MDEEFIENAILVILERSQKRGIEFVCETETESRKLKAQNKESGMSFFLEIPKVPEVDPQETEDVIVLLAKHLADQKEAKKDQGLMVFGEDLYKKMVELGDGFNELVRKQMLR